ncbi:bifunctional diguanylate cyclase/phosphodiesterase [Deinococcus sp. Arct2-2]|uniref:putative bifunctional diguanylate cyclase/phosphodiesterase n=1 Tax=Deinococcus sp. Arct2-2 TaxID=2568653 RepID=UPI0010A580AB|nr:bifunctional diguanylate cyclase/phosphodiesterase [Deinococcus sp. Arct2-2]THF68524.1 bifunctional diguanylate cyclase/phosphodiesterase [Deinococcus sp. Arct2-2]
MLPPTTQVDQKSAPEIEWRRPLLFAFPAAALAFLIGLLFDVPSGQGTLYDQISYPLALMLLLGFSVALWRRPILINTTVTGLVFAMSALFLGKLVFILFLMPQTQHVQLEMTETFFWIPALQVLSFFIPHLRSARNASIIFFALFSLVTLVYLIKAAFDGTSQGIVYALLELNLANVVLFSVTNRFIGFKEKYVRSASEYDTMRQLLGTDLLTGLPNRQRLDEVIKSATAEQRPFALLFIDLDGFKLINDTLGHIVGDLALQEAARRLQHPSDPHLFAARLSGDEFIVLAFTEPTDAQTTAKALLSSLSHPILAEGHIVSLTASIGISLYPEDASDTQELIQHADAAMYTVKSYGKNGVRRYEKATDSAIERLKQVERALTQAMTNGELSVMYQPICSLQDGVVRKLETLLRWTHPTLGSISATEFIPIAENNGQIIPLGTWALRAACHQARRWNDITGLPIIVSVNVSPLQFAQANFVDVVREALQEADLPASSLEIELTEGAVMRRIDMVKAYLRELQALGVKIAIDDFGTGYSSLAYLRDLPINCIKIDQSFIRDLSTPRRAPQFALALIEAVIGIADTLDLQVVAEGIETRKQLDMLRDLGCDLGQGYYLSRPLAEDAALEAFVAPALFAPRAMQSPLN